MDHKIWYDSTTDLVHLEFTRDYLSSDVDMIRTKVFELVENKPYRQMVVTISKTSKVENRETREKSNQLLHDAGITHIAFIGGSAANRMVAKVLLKTGMLNIKGDFFKSQEDGINWILSKR